MVNNIKRDIIVLVGVIGTLYAIAKILEINEIHQFLYIMLMIIASIMMSCMHVVLYKGVNVAEYTAYRMIATMLNFQSINMLLGLLMNMTNHIAPITYIMVLFECNLLELFCIPFIIKYVGKQVEKERIVVFVAVSFFVSTLISKKVYHYCGIGVYEILMIIIAGLLFFSNFIGMKLTRDYSWKLSKKGYIYLNAYFIARCIYYALGIYQSLHREAPGAIYMRWILMDIRVITMYFLGISIYYNCLELTWNQLVENVRSTKEKLYSNNQDRDTIVNLSHKLKTPINVIQSATQILRLDDKLDKSAVKELQNIRYQCNEAMKLITSMIDINKLRGGYLKPKFEVYNAVEGMENIIDAFATEYEDANLIFNTNEEEVNLKMDIDLLQKAGMYIIGMMLNHGRKDIYIDMYYSTINRQLSIRIYATDICQFILEHNNDVAKCKTEQVGDILALEFIRRILALHEAEVIHEASGCLRINFIGMIESDEEPVFLEDNIGYLKDQIRSCYHIT